MNLLIIEDEVKVATNLKASLEENGYEVTVTYDGTMGLKMLQQKTFDILLCDVILPGQNGVEICRQVRSGFPHIKIILLTALGTIEDKVDGLEAGADDYMVKPFDLRELLARIRAVTKRGSLGEGKSVPFMVADLELNVLKKTASRAGRQIDLTAKEYALLHYLMTNRGRVVSRMEITEQVWDMDFDPGTNVVDVYINILRKKIDKDQDQKLIHTKIGMGYILTDEVA